MRRFLFIAAGLLVLAAAGFDYVLSARADEAKPADLVDRGRYLVTFGSCNDCHTPFIMTPNGPGPDMSRQLSGSPAGQELPAVPPGVLGEGGWGSLGSMDNTVWIGPWGTSYTANLTPDKETGLGDWTLDQFKMAMRTGRHKGDGRQILPPMPWYGMAPMTDEDLAAIFAYLQSIPAVKNKVPEPVPPET